MPFHVSNAEFQEIADDQYDVLYDRCFKDMVNVAVTWEHKPTPAQAASVPAGRRLLGLFEGVPRLWQLGHHYATPVMPPRITLFKDNLEAVSNSRDELVLRVRNTLWHEAAHYFGLDHDQIHALET